MPSTNEMVQRGSTKKRKALEESEEISPTSNRKSTRLSNLTTTTTKNSPTSGIDSSSKTSKPNKQSKGETRSTSVTKSSMLKDDSLKVFSVDDEYVEEKIPSNFMTFLKKINERIDAISKKVEIHSRLIDKLTESCENISSTLNITNNRDETNVGENSLKQLNQNHTRPEQPKKERRKTDKNTNNNTTTSTRSRSLKNDPESEQKEVVEEVTATTMTSLHQQQPCQSSSETEVVNAHFRLNCLNQVELLSDTAIVNDDDDDVDDDDDEKETCRFPESSIKRMVNTTTVKLDNIESNLSEIETRIEDVSNSNNNAKFSSKTPKITDPLQGECDSDSSRSENDGNSLADESDNSENKKSKSPSTHRAVLNKTKIDTDFIAKLIPNHDPNDIRYDPNEINKLRLLSHSYQNFAVKLLSRLFEEDELIGRNVYGRNYSGDKSVSKQPLDSERIEFIKQTVLNLTKTNSPELAWASCVVAMNRKMVDINKNFIRNSARK